MFVAGVDIGSVATKALILRPGGVIAGTAVVATGAQPLRSAKAALGAALLAAGVEGQTSARVVSTGYGRRLLEFGDKTITEISACAIGSRFLGSPLGSVRTIIDLGGQDIKVIALDGQGELRDFVMNDKCAAGTGRFLEVIAQALEVPLAELGGLSLQAGRPAAITATCTVFAESEVISLLAQNVSKEDIVAGIHASIAERIATMAHQVGLQASVVFNGGGAKNVGLRAALEGKLGMKLHIPEQPQLVNALGAALEAQALDKPEND